MSRLAQHTMVLYKNCKQIVTVSLYFQSYTSTFSQMNEGCIMLDIQACARRTNKTNQPTNNTIPIDQLENALD